MSKFPFRFKSHLLIRYSEDCIGSGISGCLTPNGTPYLTDRAGPLTGLHALKVQGNPINELIFTYETDAPSSSKNIITTPAIQTSHETEVRRREGPTPEEQQILKRHLKVLEGKTARLEKSMDGGWFGLVGAERLEYMRRLILAEESNREEEEEGGDCFPLSKEEGLMGGFPFGEGRDGGEM